MPGTKRVRRAAVCALLAALWLPGCASRGDGEQIRLAELRPAMPPDAKRAPRFPRRHRVRAGETLYAIARRYYGDGDKWRTILRANRDRLPSPGALRAGQVLVIPPPP